jgi:hypothetical protein
MKTGTKVRVSQGDESILGEVVLSNESGSSLAVKLNGLLAGHVGFMAVNRAADGVYYAVVNGDPVEIEVIP